MSLWEPRQSQPKLSGKPPTIEAKPEWLDRRPWLPILFLVLLPCLVELPLAIFGLSTDPIWLNSGVAQGGQPGLLPGLPYIDPNVGFTTQALGRLAAEQWVHGKVPWWNPYSGIGLPLAGDMSPGAFFLPFVLLLLLPNGVLLLKLAMQILAGLATYALLRELRLGRLAALTGAGLYALNGTFAWIPGPVSILNTIPFLPILLYGVERARKKPASTSGIAAIGLGIAGSILAGFPEVAYINGLLALAWAIYRFAGDERRWVFAGRVAYGGILGLLLSAPLLVAFGDYLLATRAFDIRNFGDLSLADAGFSTLVLPYVYGPLLFSFGNSTLNSIWGTFLGGYAGALVLLFALIGLRGRQDRGLRLLLLLWILVAWAKTFGFAPVMALMNHVPLVREVQFFRYSPPSWEMALVILVAFGLKDLRLRPPKLMLPLLIVMALLLLAVALAWPGRGFWGWQGKQYSVMTSLMGMALLWALAGISLALLAWFAWHGERRRWALAVLLLVDAAVLFAVPELSGVRPGKVDRPAVEYLRTHLGLSRFYTLGPIQPNYGAYFEIASINHHYMPVASNWADFVQGNLFPYLDEHSGAIFWPWPGSSQAQNAGLEALIRFLPNYERVGVRYIITNPGQGVTPTVFLPTADTGNEPLPLTAGQSARITVVAPEAPNRQDGISAVGLLQGNYAGTADGDMVVHVCAESVCAGGSRPLAQSVDNSYFDVHLDEPVRARAGTALTITIEHQGGDKPFALWIWPQLPNKQQLLEDSRGGALPGKGVSIALRYGTGAENIRKVYSDTVMDIWELPHPAPYYSVVDGSCTLSAETRDSVQAKCSTAATLVRRELYMPGWQAIVNDSATSLAAHEAIFQAIPLPAGDNGVRYHFAPPYLEFALLACGAGLVGLGWEFLVMLRGWQRNRQAPTRSYE